METKNREKTKEASLKKEIELEEKRIRELRYLADFTCLVLYQQPMSLEEARRMVHGFRRIALTLFPGKGDTFDLVYGSRFRRILRERFPAC